MNKCSHGIKKIVQLTSYLFWENLSNSIITSKLTHTQPHQFITNLDPGKEYFSITIEWLHVTSKIAKLKTNEHHLIDGNHYCQSHYNTILDKQLDESFNNWDDNSDYVPRKFRYYLGRLCDEQQWTIKGDSFLTQARIKNRAYDFEKTDKGCEFKIERHLNAWDGNGPQQNVIEHWEANIYDKVLKRLDVIEN